MNQRAFSALEIKGVSDEHRIITGLATSPVPDRIGDVVEPMGAKFAKVLPLFLYHDSRLTVGTVKFGKPTKDGIPFEASLPKIAEPGALQQRVDEAWQMVKYKLIAAVSIGFRGVEGQIERLKTGGMRFLESEILELSLVPIPMQSLATIHTIKSFDAATRTALGFKDADPNDAALRAATGRTQSGVSSPGDTGTKQAASGRFFHSRSKGNQVKNLQELRELRTPKADRMKELVECFQKDGYDATDEEKAEYDGLLDEVKSLDQDIRIAGFHASQVSNAKSVDGSNSANGSASRGGMGFVRKQDPEDKYKGESFTRVVIAKALGMYHGVSPAVIAQKRWGNTNPGLVNFVKATVAGGGTGSGEWGAELATVDSRYTGDFIEYLYGMTLFDRLALKSVPGRVNVRGQDGAFTGYWVGESKAIPMSKGDYSGVDLLPLKVAGLTVISVELMEDSSPAGEGLVREGLAEAISQRVDTTFLSAVAASAGVSPGGILNGVTAIQASGADAAAVRADMQALLYPFVSNKMASGITLLMNPATAMAIGWMINALGQPEFPGVSQNGGTLNQLPVMVGDNVPAGTIIAIRSQDVWKIGDSGIQVTMSREATIEQRDDPTGATDTPTGVTTTALTNMFQEDSVAFKVTRRINYQKRRATAVQFVENAEYGGIVS